MSRQLPPRPDIQQLRKQAKTLLKQLRGGDQAASIRARNNHPGLRRLSEEQPFSEPFTLMDAQAVIAAEYGFPSWSKLRAHLNTLEAESAKAERVAALREAAGKGDLRKLESLLDAHPGLINERGGEGVRTALHQAVIGNREAAVRLLLERGADPNVRCKGDNAFPLHFAVEKNRVPIIHLLVEHGADTIGEGDYHELGVLGWATAWEHFQGDPETVAYLLSHGARHNIFSAVATGDTGAIRRLVEQRPEDLHRRMNGSRMRPMPVHLAVLHQQPEALELLLSLGADPESVDEAGMTALDHAGMLTASSMVSTLLKAGAQWHLPAAVALGRNEEAERLLHSDPGALGPQGRWRNLIIRASEHGSAEMVDWLLFYGAPVNIRDNPRTSIDSTAGYTPLHGAAWHGNLRTIPVLLHHGADVRARDEKYRGTPAGWADYAGHQTARDLILAGPIDIIEAIQYGLADRIPAILAEDVEALNRPFGHYNLFPLDAEPWHTPLSYAIVRGRTAIAKLLLDRGANTQVRSPQGKTLFDLVDAGSHPELLELLREVLGRTDRS